MASFRNVATAPGNVVQQADAPKIRTRRGKVADPVRHAAETRTAAAEKLLSLSIVIPIHNELDNLLPLYRELKDVTDRLGRTYEIILVDDGSTDGSTALIQQLANQDENVRGVIFRRNYGQTAAMQAGIGHARMDLVVTMDGDLQNDPVDIERMISKLEEGFDLVHGWRRDRQDALVNRKIPSRIANWMISHVTHFPIHDLGCTLKIMRRDILEEIDLYGDMHRFIPILLYQRGARCAELPVNHRQRVAGVTKYGIGRTLVVLLDLMTVKFLLDYASHPMRIFGGLGLACFGLSALAFLATIIMKLDGVDMTGNPLLLMTVVSGGAGLQLLSLGILGEVMARIYYRKNSKTHYGIRTLLNFPPLGHDGDAGE